MSFRISFPKDMKVSVAIDGRALLAVAYQGPGGRFESFGPCDDRAATLATMVVMRLCEGMSLDDAVEEAKKRAEVFDAKQAAKNAEGATR